MKRDYGELKNTMLLYISKEDCVNSCIELLKLIDDIIDLKHSFCIEHGDIVFENNDLITFMNDLHDILCKTEDNDDRENM